MKITELKINGIDRPVGYDRKDCTVTWNIEEAGGKRAALYKVKISQEEDFEHILCEKKGKRIPAGGVRLAVDFLPMTRYFIQVYVEDDTGDRAHAETWFETGKLGEEWKADWITYKEENIFPIFFRDFSLSGPIRKSRLYISAAGVFEVWLNGNKIGNEYLAPYLTDYTERTQILTFSLDGMLRPQNCLEIITGKGWYMGRFGMPAGEKVYGDRMAVTAELDLWYEDGTREVILTDKTWKYTESDIEEGGIYDGEVLNRMKWKEKENPARPVMIADGPDKDSGEIRKTGCRLRDRLSLPVREKERLEVQKILTTPAGETVLDFGQNFAGYVEFLADFPAGTEIVLDFGEILQNGNFYNENYRTAAKPFVYISDGRKETVRPHFTYFGFRYVRVSGWPEPCRKQDFSGVVLYSDMERSGWLDTSYKKLNRLYENTVWGMKSNFMDVPTDCPQRDERLAWTGDAQVFSSTACYHMDTRAFYRKFIEDLKTEQQYREGGIPNYIPDPGHRGGIGSIWGDIATILPATLYRFYGDRTALEESYPMMSGWVRYIDRQDAARGRKYLYDFGFTFGDWLALDGMTEGSFKGNTDDAFLSSLYYCHSAELTAYAADVLGYEEDKKEFLQLSERIREAVFHEYFTASGRLAIDTQAACVAALRFGICPDMEKLRNQLRLRLKKDGYRIRCGFVGAPHLCSVLAENGMKDLAWDFLLNEDFPGWLYCVELGATTVWERWNSVLPDGTMNPAGMNSLNHFSYGSVAEFLYAYVAGLRPEEPGFKKVHIAPCPDIRVPDVSCSYRSVSGLYRIGYRIEKDGKLRVHVEIPFDCTAEVELPGYDGEAKQLETGIYEFHYQPETDYRKPYSRKVTLKRLAKDPSAMEILRKYVPAYAGIAASGDVEMGSQTLTELSFNAFIPVDRKKLEKAMQELEQYVVKVEY